jgi:MATE family multidrug resistance protein
VEVSGFVFAALLMGWISAEALAGHQIAINVASFTFTIAMAISGAASVRVGQALGRRDLEGVRLAGATALKVGVVLACCSGLALVLLREPIAHLYGLSGETFRITTSLLLIAAFFQLADSTQAIAAGLLRGVSDTRTPAIINAIGYWVFAIPFGSLGAFVLTDNEPEPIWWGLSLALAIASAALIWRFRVITRTDRLLCSASLSAQ